MLGRSSDSAAKLTSVEHVLLYVLYFRMLFQACRVRLLEAPGLLRNSSFYQAATVKL